MQLYFQSYVTLQLYVIICSMKCHCLIIWRSQKLHEACQIILWCDFMKHIMTYNDCIPCTFFCDCMCHQRIRCRLLWVIVDFFLHYYWDYWMDYWDYWSPNFRWIIGYSKLLLLYLFSDYSDYWVLIIGIIQFAIDYSDYSEYSKLFRIIVLILDYLDFYKCLQHHT